MNFAFITVPIQERLRLMAIYRNAARDWLVFSSYTANQTARYKEIDNLATFLVHCLYKDRATTRRRKDASGYYLAPGSGLRIPMFRTVSVPLEPWTFDGDDGNDDDEVGRVAMFIIERKPFGRIGGLVHGVETFLGYFMEANATPKMIVAYCRLMNRHLTKYGVANRLQCLSHGRWSQFDSKNENACLLEIHYNVPDVEIQTRHEGNVFSPLIVVNRSTIVEAPISEWLNIWKLICVVIITALRFEPGREANYGLRLRGNASSEKVLSISPWAGDCADLLEVFQCLCGDSHVHVELVSLQADQRDHSRTSYIATSSQRVAYTSPISQQFCRTVPESRLANNTVVSLEEIAKLKSSTRYESILPVVEAAFLATDELQRRGFLLEAGAGTNSRDSYLSVAALLTYLMLDDIEIPPLFLRDSERRDLGERQKMVDDAHEVLNNRWRYITSGEGEDSIDRNDTFVDVTHNVHEFL